MQEPSSHFMPPRNVPYLAQEASLISSSSRLAPEPSIYSSSTACRRFPLAPLRRQSRILLADLNRFSMTVEPVNEQYMVIVAHLTDVTISP